VHVVASIVAAAACGGLYWAGTVQVQRADATARERNRLLAGDAQSRAGDAETRGVPPNDTVMGVTPPGRTIVQTVARAGSSLGVRVALAAATPAGGAAGTSGRTELSLQLRGSYLDTKLLLAETLDRYPALVVSRVSARSAATPGELDTLVNILLPQPAGVGEQGSSR
jgi:hypothetical protein